MTSPKKKGLKARVVGMIPGGGLVTGIFKFLWTIFRSKAFWVLALIGFVIFLALTLGIMATAPEVPPASQDGLPQPPELPAGESWAAWFVRGLSMVLLVFITAFLVRIAYQDCFTTPPNPDKKNPAPAPYFDWTKARRNSVLILAFAIPVFNIFLGALATQTWIWWFNHFTLFVFSNLGVIVAGHFYDKGNKLNQGVAFVILFLILVGFFGALASDVRKKASEAYAKASLGLGGLTLPSLPSSPFGFGSSGGVATGLTEDEVSSLRKALEKARPDQRVILGLIASCDPTHPLFAVRNGELPAIKAYAQKGVAPWKETQDCWLPKLTGARQSFIFAVVDATEEFEDSKEITTPRILGYRAVYSCQPGQDFVRRLNKNDDLVFRQDELIPTGIYVYTVGFKSVKGTARVVVSLKPKGAGPQ